MREQVNQDTGTGCDVTGGQQNDKWSCIYIMFFTQNQKESDSGFTLVSVTDVQGDIPNKDNSS